MQKVFNNKTELIKTLIRAHESVLDVGFWGQAVKVERPDWPHRVLLGNAKEVYGVDLDYDVEKLEHPERYERSSAESFNFNRTFDVVFAGDIVEHLSNPGLFLECVKQHLTSDGRLIITTPNGFNLFILLEKLFKSEPNVNKDHVTYFNTTVLTQLLKRHGFEVTSVNYIDSFKPEVSVLRRIVGALNGLLKVITSKYLETLVIVAKKHAE